MKTARFLVDQLRRLQEAGVKTFIIRGNHDAESRITRELTLPESVKVFVGRAEAVSLARGGLEASVHGVSFANKHAPESLLPKFHPPVSGSVNIGMLHTSVDGSPAHSLYAPCRLADLRRRLRLLGARPRSSAVRGAGQGGDRDAGEIPRGATSTKPARSQRPLVTIGDDRKIKVEERSTSVAQFERLRIDLAGADDWRDVLKRIDKGLLAGRAAASSEHLVARLKLTGATPLGWRLRSDADMLAARITQIWRCDSARLGSTKSSSTAQRPEQTRARRPSDPVAELRALMETEVAQSKAFQDALREMAEELSREPANGSRDGLLGARPWGIRQYAARRGARRRRGRARAFARRRQRHCRVRIARPISRRYGKFSDRRFDFGPAPVGGSDFHIVYGLNEAGKSTAAAAIFLDLLLRH